MLRRAVDRLDPPPAAAESVIDMFRDGHQLVLQITAATPIRITPAMLADQNEDMVLQPDDVMTVRLGSFVADPDAATIN